MLHEEPVYASDLTDEQWAVIEPLIPVYRWGRPRQLDMRRVVNAILYILVTGCQWAMLPKDYPHYALWKFSPGFYTGEIAVGCQEILGKINLSAYHSSPQ